ncbi:MAG: type III polyketide synthase [Planctomycetota bacterium]
MHRRNDQYQPSTHRPSYSRHDDAGDVAATLHLNDGCLALMDAHVLALAPAFPEYDAGIEYATRSAVAMSCETQSQATKVAKLYRRTGVETRGSVLLETKTDGSLDQSFYPPLVQSGSEPTGFLGPTMEARNDRFAEEAPKLASRSAKEALIQSRTAPEDITHVVTVTCTGFAAPGLDVALIKLLGLPVTTQRLALGFMGCHGLINGVRAAQGLVAADPEARVLVSSVELCSLHYQYGYDTQRIVSGSIFADGAASLVVGHDPSCPLFIRDTGSCLIPDCEEAMTWRIGDHGFRMTLDASVPGLIETHLGHFLNRWLRRHDLDVDSIGGWAVHPGGTRILTAVENAMRLDASALDISRDVLRRHGNMSSATLGAVLHDFQSQSVPTPWLMLGFGPGLEIEVALLG